MKKVYMILAAALAAATILSCEKKETVIEEPTETIVKTFTCKFAPQEAADSKVAVNLASGKTTWEVGDEIMLHGGTDGAARKLVTLTAGDISADGKTATFTVEGLDPYDRSDVGVVSTYYAQYPASAVPSGNLYYECRFNDTDKLLLAACNVGDTFEFYNLCGIISFKVAGDFDEFVFFGNNNEAVGYDVYQARVRDDGSGSYCNYWKPGNGSGTPAPITVLTKPVTADGTTDNFIYLPNTASFSGGFTIYFKKAGAITHYVTTTKPVTVNHGQLFPIGLIPAGKVHEYVAPSTHDATHPAIAGATDLGATATANCYIVDASVASNAGKVFKFKAYKGNSTNNVGAIASVSVLWETYNNATDVEANSVILEADFDKQDANDYYEICFKMPATLHAGNAVIAARDASNNILWSWHIWVPSTTITSNTYGIYSSALMDRNLGALVAATTTSVPVESFGLHYEWGRKDPFVGARGISDSSFASVSGTSMSKGYEMTLAETIAHPTTYAVYTEADSWGPWLSPTFDATLWKDAEKTMYDPCPPGYRVPKRDTTQPLHSSDLSAVVGWSDNAAAGDNAAYFTLGDPVTVFPYCGLVCENGKYVDYPGSRAFTWTSYSSSSSGSVYIMDVRVGSTHKLSSTVSARGCSVRCVAE